MKAKQQLQAYEAEVEAFLSGAAQSHLSADAKSFMFVMVESLQGRQTIEHAAAQAMEQWDREVRARTSWLGGLRLMPHSVLFCASRSWQS